MLNLSLLLLYVVMIMIIIIIIIIIIIVIVRQPVRQPASHLVTPMHSSGLLHTESTQ